MISNSVTHLQNYTNTAIADSSAPISPVTQRDRRRLRIERWYRRMEWVFLDVSHCFKSVLLVVHEVLRCITMFYMYFIMFYYVLWCLASRATIGGTTSATADRLRDRDNAAGISDNSTGIGDAAGIVDIAANVIPH